MNVRLSTQLKTSDEQMWQALQQVSSLMHVASPILSFRSEAGQELPEQWALETNYAFRLRLFGMIPLGHHCIRLVRRDEQKRVLVSNEHGRLARVWNHLIRIERRDNGMIQYTDEIEIEAGWLTVPVWLFAHVFYRHRQRKWRRLIER